MHAVQMKMNQKYDQNIFCFSFTTNHFLERKALPTTFLPSVKTLTKNVIFVFLAQVLFLKESIL